MVIEMTKPRPRGRPRKDPAEIKAVRDSLVRAGVAFLTEKGFATTGLDEILQSVKVPKGSFYHYFESKEAFGVELIKNYAVYFAELLDSNYLNEDLPPLERIAAFMEEAKNNMARYKFRRGCLVGNLGQEMAVIPDAFRQLLIETLHDWQSRTAACLKLAQKEKQISAELDCDMVAASFWIGWEGAVLRAKLERSGAPIDIYATHFLNGVQK